MPIFTIVFIGYVTKKVPAIAAKISIIFFVLTYGTLQLIIKPEMHFLHQLGILFVITCMIMLIIGKIKPREKEYVLKDNKVVDIKPWEYRYEACGVVLFLMVSMYVVCSKLGFASGNGIGIRTLVPIAVIAVVMYGLVKVVKARGLRKKAGDNAELVYRNSVEKLDF